MRHREQSVPALPLDLGDGAYRDIVDLHARVVLHGAHVRQLRLDRERSRAAACGARQRLSSSGPATRSRTAGEGQRRQKPTATGRRSPCRDHEPPPGGTIIPRSPSAGFVCLSLGGQRRIPWPQADSWHGGGM